MVKSKEIRSLKPEFNKIEKKEPWTEHEQKTFPNRQKNFIRGIQITHGMTKQEAIDYFGRMNTRSKEDFKNLEKTVKKRLEKYASSDSGGKHTHAIFTTSDFKREQAKLNQKAASKTGKGKGYVKGKKVSKKILGELPIKDWLKNKFVKTNVSPKTYNRVKNAYQKYPYATKYELQHGVNSKASQKYRIERGRPKKFEYKPEK